MLRKYIYSTIVHLLKKFAYERTCAIQTHVVQGSIVLLRQTPACVGRWRMGGDKDMDNFSMLALTTRYRKYTSETREKLQRK